VLVEAQPASIVRDASREIEMPQITGGCLCGQLRYAANTEPVFSAVCHCKTCQKQSGTAFNIVIAAPQPAVSIQGSLTWISQTRAVHRG
jgi:hypothetical protein